MFAAASGWTGAGSAAGAEAGTIAGAGSGFGAAPGMGIGLSSPFFRKSSFGGSILPWFCVSSAMAHLHSCLTLSSMPVRVNNELAGSEKPAFIQRKLQILLP